MCLCVAEWRDIILDKGLELNTGKYIVMVGCKAVVGYSVYVVSVAKEYRLSYRM